MIHNHIWRGQTQSNNAEQEEHKHSDCGELHSLLSSVLLLQLQMLPDMLLQGALSDTSWELVCEI